MREGGRCFACRSRMHRNQQNVSASDAANQRPPFRRFAIPLPSETDGCPLLVPDFDRRARRAVTPGPRPSIEMPHAVACAPAPRAPRDAATSGSRRRAPVVAPPPRAGSRPAERTRPRRTMTCPHGVGAPGVPPRVHRGGQRGARRAGAVHAGRGFVPGGNGHEVHRDRRCHPRDRRAVPATPRFAALGAKGVCCTLASDDKTFEAHVFLKTIREVALARSERGGRKIYAIGSSGNRRATPTRRRRGQS